MERQAGKGGMWGVREYSQEEGRKGEGWKDRWMVVEEQCVFALTKVIIKQFSSPPRFLQLMCSLVFGSAAMLFKEHGATVFGVCLAYDVLIISRKEVLR